jgi:Zn-finger nucleic acid-binding protein
MAVPAFWRAFSDALERGAKPSSLLCPACAQAVLDVKVAQHRVPWCAQCGGLWVEEEKLFTLPLRPRPELEAEAREAARDDAALDSEDLPDDLSASVLTSTFGVPFVEGAATVNDQAPILTWSLIAAIALLTRVAWKSPLWGAALTLHPDDRLRFLGGNLVSYFFVQPSPGALLAQLYFLWLFGAPIERLIGPGWLAALLAVSVISGGLLQSAVLPMPLIGASGGVVGLMVFFSLAFPRARIGMPFMGSLARFRPWMWIIVWACFEVIPLVWTLPKAPQIFAFAPLGGAGAAFGFWALGVWREEKDAI